MTRNKLKVVWASSIILTAFVAFVLTPLLFAPTPRLQVGYSTTPCASPVFKVPITGGSGVAEIFPASISFKFQIWHTTHVGIPANIANPNGKPDVTWYECNLLVVNNGLDILAQLTGNNKTGGASYMSATTTSVFAAADTTCAGEQTTQGFTRANVLASFAHTIGTSTYTLSKLWTYTGSTSTVIAGACLFEHSGAFDGVQTPTVVLIDETALASTATVNANGDQLTVTATITV